MKTKCLASTPMKLSLQKRLRQFLANRHWLTKFTMLAIWFGMRFCAAGAEREVNVASLVWGTRIEATSTSFDASYGVANVADGSVERGHAWFSADGASLPQTLTLNFAEPFRLTRARLRQAQWLDSMYRTKDFRVEASADGATFESVAEGSLADSPDAEWAQALPGRAVRALRIVILSSYTKVQTCGLGEVELFAVLPEERQPPFDSVSPAVEWRTLRGIFKMNLDLDPPAPLWSKGKGKQSAPAGSYTSGPYEMVIESDSPEPGAQLIRWRIRRTDDAPFKLRQYRLDCRTSYAGVYKLFHPGSMAQQNYSVDLPFNSRGVTNAEEQSPVVWMQQTDGQNTLTLGLLDQQPATIIEAKTYNPDNGGEAPGIANSYVRVQFTRTWPAERTTTLASDGLYVNADAALNWHDALGKYSAAVDAARHYQPADITAEWLLNPLWHSWYAHSSEIDEKQIRDDARRAAALGAKTIQLDAGWNIPPGVGYELAVDGAYRFDAQRFPHAAEMIRDLHAAGQRVILHVAPLVMGPRSPAYAGMKDCVWRSGGKETPYLDPRLAKTHEYLLAAWSAMFADYDIDGLWSDFLELPPAVDAPPAGMPVVSQDVHESYTMLMEKLAAQARKMKPDAALIFRRGTANHNAKLFSTHVWPMDSPQDYNVNRRDVVYLKTLGPGVLTHACCTSWPISESELNVARQMASVVLAGVPAFSVKLAESPAAHNEIIRQWLAFYERHKRALQFGHMTPLLPTPPSAALRIEAPDEAFFGLFEAAPGWLPLTRPVPRVTIVNAFSTQLVGRLQGAEGTWRAEIFDQSWKPLGTQTLTSQEGGLTLNFHGPTACFSVVLTRQ